MPLASVRDSGTAGIPAAREARRRASRSVRYSLIVRGTVRRNRPGRPRRGQLDPRVLLHPHRDRHRHGMDRRPQREEQGGHLGLRGHRVRRGPVPLPDPRHRFGQRLRIHRRAPLGLVRGAQDHLHPLAPGQQERQVPRRAEELDPCPRARRPSTLRHRGRALLAQRDLGARPGLHQLPLGPTKARRQGPPRRQGLQSPRTAKRPPPTSTPAPTQCSRASRSTPWRRSWSPSDPATSTARSAS